MDHSRECFRSIDMENYDEQKPLPVQFKQQKQQNKQTPLCLGRISMTIPFVTSPEHYPKYRVSVMEAQVNNQNRAVEGGAFQYSNIILDVALGLVDLLKSLVEKLGITHIFANVATAVKQIVCGCIDKVQTSLLDCAIFIAKAIGDWFLSALTTKLQNTLSSYLPDIRSFLLDSLLLSLIYYNWNNQALCAVLVACLGWVTLPQIADLCNLGGKVMQAQSLEDGFMPFLGLLGLQHHYVGPDKMDSVMFGKFFKNGASFVRSMKIYMTDLPYCAMVLSSWVAAIFGFDDPFLDQTIRRYPEIAPLQERLLNVATFCTNDMRTGEAMEVVHLHSDLMKFRKAIVEKGDPIMYRYLSDMIREISSSYGHAKNLVSPSSHERAQPIIVNISGEAGVGKSHCENHMFKQVAVYLDKHYGIKASAPLSDDVYTHNQQDVYMSGFRGQRLFRIDELFLVADSATKPNPILQMFISLGSVAPMTANMADLESKGAYVNPVFIGCSSNTKVADYKISSVNRPAFTRRITYDIECKVKHEYSMEVSGPNNTKITRLDPIRARGVDFDLVWEFDLVSAESGQVLKKGLNYSHVMSLVFSSLDEYMGRSKDMADDLVGEYDRIAKTIPPCTSPRASVREPVRIPDEELNLPDVEKRPNLQAQAMWPFSSVIPGCQCDEIILVDVIAAMKSVGTYRSPLCARSSCCIKGCRSVNSKHISSQFRDLLVRYPDELEQVELWLSSVKIDGRKAHEIIDELHSKHLSFVANDLQEYVHFYKEYPAEPRWINPTKTNPICPCSQCSKKLDFVKPLVLLGAAMMGLGFYWARRDYAKNSNFHTIEDDDHFWSQSRTDVPLRSALNNAKPTRWVLSAQDSHAILGRAPDIESVEMYHSESLEDYNQTVLEKISNRKGKTSMTERYHQITNKIHHNMYRVHVMQEDGVWRDLDNAFGLKGHCLFTVGHSHRYLNDCTKMRLWRAGDSKPIVFNRKDFKLQKHPKLDLLCITVSVQKMGAVPNILKHFVTKSTSCSFGKTRALVIGQTTPPGKEAPYIKTAYVMANAIDNDQQKYDSSTGESYTLRARWVYDYPARKGDCGSLLHVGVGLAGMHVAGTDSIGMSIPLCQETFAHFSALEDQIDEEDHDVRTYTDSAVAVFGDVEPFGEHKHHLVSQSSKITHSIGYEHYEDKGWVCKQPANLGQFTNQETGETFDTGHRSAAKMGQEKPHNIDEDLLQLSAKAYQNKLLQLPKQGTDRVYTFDEAVFGVEGDDSVNSIDVSTSSGYGWEDYGPNKKKLVDLDEKTCKHVVPMAVMQLEEKYQKLKRAWILVKQFKKDELIAIEKALIGKCRVVSAFPLHFVLLTRMYFLGLVSFVIKNRLQNEIALGLDPQSAEWQYMEDIMHTHSDRSAPSFAAGDFSGFDASFHRFITWTIFKIILAFYGHKNWDGSVTSLSTENRVRYMIFHEIVSCRLTNGPYIFGLKRGHPSGHVLTTVLNSMYNCVVFRYVTTTLLRQANISFYPSQFDDHFTLVAFGDDNVLGVASAYKSIVNQNTLPVGFAECGMIYTNETKTDDQDQADLRFFKDCYFLGRSSKPTNGCNRGALRIDIIKNILAYSRSTDDPYLAYATNVDTVCRELTLHGRKVFTEITDQIREVNGTIENLGPLTIYEFDKYVEDLTGGAPAPLVNPPIKKL